MAALDDLAHYCGIQDSSLDAFGRLRKITPETKRLLLEAMHLQIADEGQTRATLDELESREWLRAVPPVVVAYLQPDSAEITVPVVLPRSTHQIRWLLTLEDDGSRSGAANFQELALVGSRGYEGRVYERRALVLDSIPSGYHTFALEGFDAHLSLIVTPARCWLPPEAADRRLWGVAANLYLLRSQHNWGIGDFSDLRELLRLLSAQGADVLGLNPLHAMFLDKPEDASPYSPSDRLLLNVLNIDVQAIPELASCEKAKELLAGDDFQQKLRARRAASLLDYTGVAELKLAILPLLFETFERQKNSTLR